ncbi:MAG: hypothetical protein ACRDKV_10130 [Solirubrobacterales bacterium]
MSDERTEQNGADQSASDPGTPGRGAEDVPGGGSGQPNEEEVRARLEEQIRNLRVQDLLVESTVSVLNLTARRIAKDDERDLEQARVGIDAVRAWVDLLPDDAANQIRNALSELQMLYAQTAGAPSSEEAGAEGGAKARREAPAGSQEGPPAQPQRPSGEPPPRIWTPPGSN